VASLRALNRRIQLLDAEIADHSRAITTLVRAWRPDLLTPCGVGPIVAATVLCAWSHPGRCRTDAAFAMLGGAAPIPASSGQTVRVRRNRPGDRHLNQAFHLIVLTRLRYDPATRVYAQRRRAEAKPTPRSNAAWSATSPASSTSSSKPTRALTQHRSVRQHDRSSVATSSLARRWMVRPDWPGVMCPGSPTRYRVPTVTPTTCHARNPSPSRPTGQRSRGRSVSQFHAWQRAYHGSPQGPRVPARQPRPSQAG
jgi:hypothetical protein